MAEMMQLFRHDREDLMAMHRRCVGPENFLLAVSGNFDEKAMKKALESVFADWPYAADPLGLPASPAHVPAAGLAASPRSWKPASTKPRSSPWLPST